MELKKNENVQIFEIIAQYRKQEKNAPFLSILKFAIENKDIISSNDLQNSLLQNFSVNACENLLNRMCFLRYFDKKNDKFQITERGKIDAQSGKIYLPEISVLRIFFVENIFVEQKIVKIETQNERNENNNSTQQTPQVLNNLIGKEISLKTGNYIIDKIENKCVVKNNRNELFTIQTSNQNSTIKILDLEYLIDIDEKTMKNAILSSKYSNYDEEKEFLKIKFDEKNNGNINFQRNILIEKPKIQNIEFEKVEIKDVEHIPATNDDARIWQEELIKSKINNYFTDNNEFKKLSEEVAKQFQPHYDLQPIYKEHLINRVDFYKRAKLETIDILTY